MKPVEGMSLTKGRDADYPTFYKKPFSVYLMKHSDLNMLIYLPKVPDCPPVIGSVSLTFHIAHMKLTFLLAVYTQKTKW